MVTIGNDTLPGTITTVESAATAGANLGAPGTPVIVGQHYPSEGSASEDTMYRITRSNRARDLFGEPENSMLTRAVQGALVEGAYPVYAVGAAMTDVTAEDLSGVTGDTTTLANAPILEVADDITFTVNSTEKDTVLYYDGDPENVTDIDGEVFINPQTGKAKCDEDFGNTGDEVDYTYADYSNTYDVIDTSEVNDVYVRNVVDFIVPVDENSTVYDNAHTKSTDMEANGWFNIAVGGAGEPYIIDENTGTDETSTYTNSFDSSRSQLIYPSRDDSGNTIIGEYIGRRSALGIDAHPIFKTINSVDRLQQTLLKAEQENLVNEHVNPLEERRGEVRIVEDLTAVQESNTDEAAWDRGFSRLLTDYVVEQANERADAFVGQFNETSVLNSMRGNVSSDLRDLLEVGQIQAYSLVVEAEDAEEVILDVGIKAADPIRNVRLTVAAGNVSNGVTATVEDE